MIKKIVKVAVVGAALSMGQNAMAGIPVLDIEGLARNILILENTIKSYKEQLQQTGLQNNQLLQMYTDYKQTLKEYETLLKQAQSLSKYLKEEERDIILGALGVDSPTTVDLDPWGKTMSTQNDPMYEQAREKVKDMYDGDRQVSDVIDESFYVDASPEIQAGLDKLKNRDYYKAQAPVQQQYNYDMFYQVLENNRKSLAQLEKSRQSLGDESLLASVQLGLLQTQSLLGRLDFMTEVMLKSYQESNRLTNEMYTGTYEANLQELERVQNARLRKERGLHRSNVNNDITF